MATSRLRWVPVAILGFLLTTAATCEPNDAFHIVNDTAMTVRVQNVGTSSILNVVKLAPHGEGTTYLSRTNNGCSRERFQAVDTSTGRVVARLVGPCPGDVWHIRTH